jgi:hypothetical protein
LAPGDMVKRQRSTGLLRVIVGSTGAKHVGNEVPERRRQAPNDALRCGWRNVLRAAVQERIEQEALDALLQC